MADSIRSKILDELCREEARMENDGNPSKLLGGILDSLPGKESLVAEAVAGNGLPDVSTPPPSYASKVRASSVEPPMTRKRMAAMVAEANFLKRQNEANAGNNEKKKSSSSV